MLFAVLGGVLVLFVIWSNGAFPILMRPWFLAGLGLLLVLATLVTRKSTRDGYWSRPAGPFSAEFLLALKHNLFSLALFFLMADPPSPWNPEFTWTTVRSQILFAIAL